MAESTQNINEIENENNHHSNILSNEIISIYSKSETKSDGGNEYINKGQKIYRIANYHFNCEEHNQIAFIIPLVRTTPKFILFIILNICTIGIINFFVAWFPKLILYIYYSYTELPNATHLGIFNKIDQEFEVVDIKIIDLPPIDYDSPLSIVKRFNLNIEKGAKQITVFEYKLFNYIYSRAIDTFEAIYYRIKSPYHDIVEKYSTGLNPNEVLFMKKIFGVCDIDIKINSCGKILP